MRLLSMRRLVCLGGLTCVCSLLALVYSRLFDEDEQSSRLLKVINGDLLDSSRLRSEEAATEPCLDCKSTASNLLAGTTLNLRPATNSVLRSDWLGEESFPSLSTPAAAADTGEASDSQLPRKLSQPAWPAALNCSGRSPLCSNNHQVLNCLTGEVVGHGAANVRAGPVRARGARVVHETAQRENGRMRQNSFERVFESRAWGHSWDLQHRGLNASGMGSTLQWTQELVGTLHILINALKLQLGVARVRLLDVPCGDMAWMSRFLRTRDDIDYTGADIVPALIAHHKDTFRAEPWRFLHVDVVEEGVEGAYDLVLSRTLAQHLYLADVTRLLRRFSAIQAPFLLTTSFYRTSANSELDVNEANPGRFRPINLELPPFGLTPPCCVVRDGPPDSREGWDHFLALWRLPLLQVRGCTAQSVRRFKLGTTDKELYSCTDWSLRQS